MSVLHVFRGLPGSGKSTTARKLAEETGAILIEPDSLLIRNGQYDYTPDRYRFAVNCAHIMVEVASEVGADIIYADVLPRRAEVRTIQSFLLCESVYTLEVHDLKITPEESRKRNKHGVLPEDIERMSYLWEDWESEI